MTRLGRSLPWIVGVFLLAGVAATAVTTGGTPVLPGGAAVATGGTPVLPGTAGAVRLNDVVPSFEALVRFEAKLRPELVGVHPRVFVTKSELAGLRERARTTHRDEWQRALRSLPALQGPPPPPPGPQERRSQNNVAYAISGAALAYAIERDPRYLEAARTWVLAAIDYEPWGYAYSKPNIDLAAGHLLYAISWSYDLLYQDLTDAERGRIRKSLEQHAGLVCKAFSPGPGKRFNFTQNHNFIPTAGLGIAALALMGESADAPKWAALARAHHHRANQLLSPDGYYYEGLEYLDLLVAVARALLRRVGACDGGEPVGAWARAQLEAVSCARPPARRPERLRFRRHLGRAADAGEDGGGVRPSLPGRDASEQLQRALPRRRTSPRSRNAGGG